MAIRLKNIIKVALWLLIYAKLYDNDDDHNHHTKTVLGNITNWFSSARTVVCSAL